VVVPLVNTDCAVKQPLPIFHDNPSNLSESRHRWSSDSVLAIGPKIRGFKPGRGRRIYKGDKIQSLMMEAVRTSETSVDNHFTWQYIPEDNSEQADYK
jgi:hypothetical protein